MRGGGLNPCKRHGATSPGASTTRPQPADGVSPSYLLQNYVYFVDEHTRVFFPFGQLLDHQRV